MKEQRKMKKEKSWRGKFGIFLLFTFLTFILVGCGDDVDGGDPMADHLKGTWTAGNEAIKFSGNSFEFSENNNISMRGTYTADARSITANIEMTVKELHGDFLNEMEEGPDFESIWYNKSKVIDAFRKWVKETYPNLSDAQIAILLESQSDNFNDMFPTMTGSVNDNTLTVGGTTYTKAGGSSGGGTGDGGGMTWTGVNATGTLGTSYIEGIAYGDGKFVAATVSNIAYSSDGVTWTKAEKPSSNDIGAIAYGGGTFVAGCERGAVLASQDGETWTVVVPAASSPFGNINAAAYGDGRFVIGGYGRTGYSTDGTTWESTQNNIFNSDYNDQIYTIAYGNGTFVAGGTEGKMMTSTDGTSWTSVANSTFGTNSVSAIAYGNNKFVAGGGNGQIATSTDGTNWTPVLVSTSGLNGILAIAYGNNRFVAAGSNGKMAYSADGVNWIAVNVSGIFETRSIQEIAFGGGRFVAGAYGSNMAYSTGSGSFNSGGGGPALTGTVSITGTTVVGQTLTASTSALGGTGTITYQWKRGSTNISTNSSTYKLVTADLGTTLTVTVMRTGYSGSVTSAPTATITDGSDWTRVVDTTFGTSLINMIAYGGNKFVAVGGSGKMAYSTDGITWTAVADSTLGIYNIYAIAYGGGKFVAGNSNGKIAYSSDGILWTAAADSTLGTSLIDMIVYGNSKFVAASGTSGTMAYSADGINWTAVSNPFGNQMFDAIAYGGGTFVAANNSGAIAYSSDGITWVSAGENILGYMYDDSSNNKRRIRAIAYGGNKFIAAGQQGKMATSTNGASWTLAEENSTFKDYNISLITYVNNRFAAMYYPWLSPEVVTSPDGVTWTVIGSEMLGKASTNLGNLAVDINTIAYGGGRLIVAGGQGRMAYYTGN